MSTRCLATDRSISHGQLIYTRQNSAPEFRVRIPLAPATLVGRTVAYSNRAEAAARVARLAAHLGSRPHPRTSVFVSVRDDRALVQVASLSGQGP
jgi:hypothetical protein